MMDLWLFSESKLRTKFDTIFSMNELLEYINNTYRNISITGNIHVTFVNKPVGLLINPK